MSTLHDLTERDPNLRAAGPQSSSASALEDKGRQTVGPGGGAIESLHHYASRALGDIPQLDGLLSSRSREDTYMGIAERVSKEHSHT